MIRITVEVIPGGDESKKRLHCVAEIRNTGKESTVTKGRYGSYKAAFYMNAAVNTIPIGMKPVNYVHSKVWRRGGADHIHRKLRGAWDILFCCLYNAGLYERNKSALSKRRG